MRRLLVTLVVLLHAQSGACSCEATLHKHYNGTLNCAKHRDMCHFAPVLRRLASHGSSVVEMGVRSIVSSWALLLGLYEFGGAPPSAKWMLSVDLRGIKFNAPIQAGQSCGLNVSFVQHDSATVALPAAYDLLFIDTMHTYGHLRRELAAHANRARRYIVLHDTIIDGVVSDIVRLRGKEAVPGLAKVIGYSEDEIRRGLQDAIDEFLTQHAEWTVFEHYSSYPGLTVLARHESIRPGGVPYFKRPSTSFMQRLLGR